MSLRRRARSAHAFLDLADSSLDFLMFTIDLGFRGQSWGSRNAILPGDLQDVSAEGVIGRIRASWFAAGVRGAILRFHRSPAVILPG